MVKDDFFYFFVLRNLSFLRNNWKVSFGNFSFQPTIDAGHIGTFKGSECFLYPCPDLCVEIYRQRLWLYTCSAVGPYLDRCSAFPKNFQSDEFTTGGLQLSCRNIWRMISGNRMHLSLIFRMIISKDVFLINLKKPLKKKEAKTIMNKLISMTSWTWKTSNKNRESRTSNKLQKVVRETVWMFICLQSCCSVTFLTVDCGNQCLPKLSRSLSVTSFLLGSFQKAQW